MRVGRAFSRRRAPSSTVAAGSWSGRVAPGSEASRVMKGTTLFIISRAKPRPKAAPIFHLPVGVREATHFTGNAKRADPRDIPRVHVCGYLPRRSLRAEEGDFSHAERSVS